MSFSKGRVPSKHLMSKYVKLALAAMVIVIAIANIFKDYESFKKAQRAIDGADGMFSAHYIDIGQGDATLLRSPSGKCMLIDCGPTGNSSYLVKYLSDLGVERLDYLLITHPHEDHYGGAAAVMESFEVEELIIHEDFTETYPYDKFIDMAQDYGASVTLAEAGDDFELDGCAQFEIIAPEAVDEDDLNESSLCFRVVFGSTAFMFTGDAESGTERYMLSTGKPLEADVLQAGHHGSSTSNTKRFVEAVSPEYAVVSCEKDNSYGHPHKETVETFEELGVKMLRTDELGSIVFVSDGATVTYVENFFENPSLIAGNGGEKKGNMLIRYIKSLF